MAPFSTPQAAVDALMVGRTSPMPHFAAQSSPRVRVHYGDPETGRDWGDTHGVVGPLYYSAQPDPARRYPCHAGAKLDVEHIVRIRYANRREGGDLYRHPSYTPPNREDYTPRQWALHFA